MPTAPMRVLLIGTLALSASACSKRFDLDLRSIANGFDTTPAVQSTPARPGTADARGVMSYSNYQVALARRGETAGAVAARLGINAQELARYNGVDLATPLREGELLALPVRVAAADGAAPTATLPKGVEPRRHQVKAGETAFSVARLYDVPVQSLATWNNLDSTLSVRTGQQLLIPVAGAVAPVATTALPADSTLPGAGSPTPVPPSAATALPTTSPAVAPVSTPTAEAPREPAPQPAPKLDTTAAVAQAPAKSARLAMPVSGSIIREYAKGRNEGIDIAAAPGTPVKAAGSGTIAAVTANTNGAKIVVLKHASDLLTVYVNVTDLTVSKGAKVSRGQTIAKVASGDPSALHFEVRKGLESADPSDYLP